MSLTEEWIVSKFKLIFVGSFILIVLLGISNIWFFTTLTGQVKESQTQLDQKNDQVQTLQSQVDSLSNQLNQKNSQLTTLQNQVENLSSQINVLNQNYLALNQSYTELQRQYEDLLFHYNILNKPASNFTTVKDLNISLAIDRTIYYYKDPVSGNATIRYLNGTAFEGEFILRVFAIQTEGPGLAVYFIFRLSNEFPDFVCPPPVFRSGPGSYGIEISRINTADGYIVADEPGPRVLVEAK